MAGVDQVLGLFRKAAIGKEMPPPEIKTDFEVVVEFEIDDDFDDDDEPALECIGRSFGISYIDSKGHESRRRITVRSLIPQESDLLIRAYCHERSAARSFKASRIREIVDLETGEVVDDAAEFFAKYLSVDPTYEALRTCGPGLQVLTFLARCDGEFHDLEKAAIVEYVVDKANSPVDPQAIESHVNGLHPDTISFDRGLELAAERGEKEVRDIVKWMKRVVEADGIIADEEFEWLMEAEEVLAA